MAANPDQKRMQILLVLKNVLDRSGAAVGLLLFGPGVLLIGGLIRMLLGKPLLLRQLRIGRSEKPFTLVKFRTMTDHRDSRGTLLPDEQRLTAVGRFLRSYSLDELPQLWNVLNGDMSLVGPRPLLPQYLGRYTARQRRRHEVKPGITGWAQVNGRNALTWEEKFELDVWYVSHWSFGLDVKILWMTVLKVVCGEGISQQGHATMPEFTGGPTQSRQNE
jgi:lipopolysaccharide/colanic/teichoic acid biosynthesis glycosyltransferase